MHIAVNNYLVTIIPKTSFSCKVKYLRPVSCCTILYKLISKIMANSLGRILGRIMDVSQIAFVPGQHIHDHILLVYELIKGYNANSRTPRCMIHMDIQKAYIAWSGYGGFTHIIQKEKIL